MRSTRRLPVLLAALLPSITCVATLGGGSAVADSAAAGATSTTPATSAYRPVGPCRLLDTRDAGAPLAAGAALSFATAGRCGIPDGASALALTVIITGPAAAGFAVVWQTGLERPPTSTLNFAANETRANGAIVAVGAQDSIDVMVNVAAHVIVDVTGAFVPATTSRAGRFVAMPPTRVLDTRVQGGRPAPGTSVTVPLPATVPTDATALAVTIATTDSGGAGYFTAFPAGMERTESSALNTDDRNQIRSAGQIVPVSAGGFSVFSQNGDHVVVDVTGWFTGRSAAASSVGLFVPVRPTRLIDTRGSLPVYPGGTVEIEPGSVAGAGAALGASSPVAAIAANWTMTSTWAAGFLTAYPARTDRPVASTANADRRAQDVAQFGIIGASTTGVAVYASAGTHLVVDATGWFTGARVAAVAPAPAPNTPVADVGKRVLLMGDSTLAGVRWYTNSQHALGGSSFVLDMESCRRLIGASCRGREGRVPPNAIDAILAHAETFDVVVVMTGYNDYWPNFGVAFDEVVSAARQRGAKEIIWLTYREGSTYANPSTGTLQDAGFRTQNQILRDKVASGSYGDVRIADWNTYTAATSGWFTSDGIHFTLAGAYAAADYISRQIAFSHGEPCPMPWALGGGIDVPCTNPDLHPSLADPIGLYAGNPNDVHCYEIGLDRHVECRVDPKLSH